MKEKIAARTSPRASLEHLKSQAKSLLKNARDQNPHALARLRRANVLPEKSGASLPPLKLAHAQLAIARENGSATWTALRDSLASASGIPATPAVASSPTLAEAPIQISGLNQIWLDCTDLEATDTFYRDILGLRKTGGVPGMMSFFDCQGTSLLLGKREVARPNSILYFRLPDTVEALQVAYNRLKAAGAKVGDSPHCIAKNWQGRDSWLAFFSDPSGNQLAFKVDVPSG